MSTGNIVTTTTITIGEARALTDRIKSAAEQLWGLLLEAHEREAWRVLGYRAFAADLKAMRETGVQP